MSEEKDQLPETSDGRSRRNRKDINYKKFHEGTLSDSDGDTEYESSHDIRVLTRILKIGVPETSFRKSRSPTM